MKIYVIFGSIVLIAGLITANFVYVIKNERIIKELQQENIILKANEEQSKIENQNNQKIIIELNNKIKKQIQIERNKQEDIIIHNKKIHSLTITEQEKLINDVFGCL